MGAADVGRAIPLTFFNLPLLHTYHASQKESWQQKMSPALLSEE